MNSTPALVLVTTSFPIRGDGSEAAGSFVSDLAEALAVHRPVRVVAPGPVSGREDWRPGVEVFRYAAPARPLSTLKPWRLADLIALAGVLREGQAMTRAAAGAGPMAHVLALWALPSGHWARRVAQGIGVPYSVWTLGSDIWSLGRVPLLRSHLRRVLADAHRCYSDGLLLAEDTRRIAGREVRFLPSTRRIDRRRTTPLKDEPPYRLLFLGRWHPNKGIDLLLEALTLLVESDWQRIEAVEICGGGPLEPQVKKAVATLQAAGRQVALRGFLDKPAAEEAILRADYLLIPSRIESIPVVFSDAIKLGCPVVASPVGDLPGLVEAGAGVVATDVGAAPFADAIRSALRRPPSGFAATLSSLAREFDLATGIAPALLGQSAESPDAGR